MILYKKSFFKEVDLNKNYNCIISGPDPMHYKEQFKTNFIFHEDILPKIIKLINHKGILNIGGKSQSVYNFAKFYNSKIKRMSAKKMLGKNAPKNISMNINKFLKLSK